MWIRSDKDKKESGGQGGRPRNESRWENGSGGGGREVAAERGNIVVVAPVPCRLYVYCEVVPTDLCRFCARLCTCVCALSTSLCFVG